MTRFARSKGSKASNEKKAEEATSWSEMKAGILLESDNEEVLDADEENDVDLPTAEEVQTVWATLTSSLKTKKKKDKEEKKESKLEDSSSSKKDKKKKKKFDELPTSEPEKVDIEKKQKKKKKSIEICNEELVKETTKSVNLIVQQPREKKRKKEELQANVIIVNGEEIKLVPFDGFLIQEEDAKRIRDLRCSLMHLPKVEREKTIKLERRRAEKALSRLKKRVCFQCRGVGHNLSECPELANQASSGTGICYKCGSTEHTHFQCKVAKGQEFRYAQCFICKEQGHISKQCPDNPRGLYPRGGACNVCGDVTHLKKDCPDFAAEKEENLMTVKKRSNTIGIDDLDDDNDTSVKRFVKKKKHIKF